VATSSCLFKGVLCTFRVVHMCERNGVRKTRGTLANYVEATPGPMNPPPPPFVRLFYATMTRRLYGCTFKVPTPLSKSVRTLRTFPCLISHCPSPVSWSLKSSPLLLSYFDLSHHLCIPYFRASARGISEGRSYGEPQSQKKLP
jgi:hypothetical protein